VRIYKDKNSKNVYVSDIAVGPSEDFTYAVEDSKIDIIRKITKVKEVARLPWSQIKTEDDQGFSSVSELTTYLDDIFTPTEIAEKRELFDQDFNSLINRPVKFPPEPHTHTLEEVSDFDSNNFATASQGLLADSALQDEALTSLVKVGNELRYLDESGNIQIIDLENYLDDTNAARIESGLINSEGIATFKRDDDSTFTIDFSVLNDKTFINQQIANHTQESNPHLITKEKISLGNVPNIDATKRDNHTGTQLASTISDFDSAIASYLDRSSEQDNSDTQNLTTIPINRIDLTRIFKHSGKYIILVNYQWSTNSTSQDFVGELLINNQVVRIHRQESKDAAGAGVFGTDQLIPSYLKYEFTATANTNVNIKFRFAGGANGIMAAVYNSIITIERYI